MVCVRRLRAQGSGQRAQGFGSPPGRGQGWVRYKTKDQRSKIKDKSKYLNKLTYEKILTDTDNCFF